MENLVEEALDDMKDHIEFCHCARCHDDIVALALNNLPPQYAVTSKGASMVKIKTLRYQYRTDIQKELIKAIDIVNENPRH